MPYFKSSQEWLEQSALLLEARPSTTQHQADLTNAAQTRILTRYSIKPVKPRAKKTDDDTGAAASGDESSAAAKPPRASLVIKTYDPVSGVTLKYRTTKAAEVSRLVYSSLGRLGRVMAAVPVGVPEESMPDAPAGNEGSGPGEGKAGVAGATAQTQQMQQQQSQQGGGGKKKKKGRK
ncbi:hypothetical protein TOPH_02524 [Tolypocladium ophioglossoides CBS 100239]|uniref:SRP9 domain-containing protein n=1 Tax=Tolypocladium ophioglossoides (strain CBS 100239) TaxID=1163406 RepID=A0A0L0NEZ8_TOLOC|nr:hypothetical protein TOPH_02524 [Tolypocladium ophioglossoides CBS 100239]